MVLTKGRIAAYYAHFASAFRDEGVKHILDLGPICRSPINTEEQALSIALFALALPLILPPLTQIPIPASARSITICTKFRRLAFSSRHSASCAREASFLEIQNESTSLLFSPRLPLAIMRRSRLPGLLRVGDGETELSAEVTCPTSPHTQHAAILSVTKMSPIPR